MNQKTGVNCLYCVKDRMRGQGQKLGDWLGDCCKVAEVALGCGGDEGASDTGIAEGFSDGVSIKSEKRWTLPLILFK